MQVHAVMATHSTIQGTGPKWAHVLTIGLNESFKLTPVSQKL